ncbi:hypothetical protein BKA83DRAFT_4339931 [Pisolithus microcarpus]|nr:hypothetical protein BKA83DRAFT_4339931 [Pisolithus microcarpus]
MRTRKTCISSTMRWEALYLLAICSWPAKPFFHETSIPPFRFRTYVHHPITPCRPPTYRVLLPQHFGVASF